MSTDRELLELAANAAGVDGLYAENSYRKSNGILIADRLWNSFTNDGDALRLAVKLRMTIRPEPAAVCAGWSIGERGAPTRDGLGPWFWKEWYRAPGDELAATRRAIVRAAAAIGAGNTDGGKHE